MVKTRRIILCALLGLVLGTAAQAHRDPKHGKIKGEITAVNAAADPDTVTIVDGARSVTLKVVPSTKIEVGDDDDDDGTFADLRVGQRAHAKFDPVTLIASKIEVEEDEEDENEAVGKVLSADPVSGQVVLDTTGDGVADLTLTTDAQTELKIGHAEISPAQLDLLNGLVVKAEFNDAFLAEEIKAAASPHFSATGRVTAVDAAAGTLSLETTAGVLVFEVASGADVRINGRKVSLSQVLVGDTARVSYIVNGDGIEIALRIDVTGATPRHLKGRLVAVGASTITVATRTGDVVVAVNSQTDLRIKGKRSTLADLSAALATGNEVKISAQYFERAGLNVATKVHANVKRRR